MALLISGETITLNNGLTVNSAYARTNAGLTLNGSEIYIATTFWASEEAYNNRAMPFEPTNIQIPLYVPYDRTTMGSDLLFAANEIVKLMLETEGFTVNITEL